MEYPNINALTLPSISGALQILFTLYPLLTQLPFGPRTLTSAFNHNPKVYVDVDCIELVDPLRHGFNIVVPKPLFQSYLDPFQLPLLYVTAVPLNGKGKSVRDLVYIEKLPNKVVTLSGLEEKAWYYVCLEFENMHRHKRQGNTSTTCELHRTLDEFGAGAESTIREVSFTSVSDDAMEFALELQAATFPLFLDVYLEQGPTALQTFYVGGPKAIRVEFANLLSGFNYGRLCTIERPLSQSFTALGRSISVHKERCHLDGLETVPWRVGEKEKLTAKGGKDEPVYRKYRTVSGAQSGLRRSSWVLGGFAVFVVSLTRL